ncbi:MAG: hypothetical protein KC493_17300 [Bacteriovoracaceae bacterium]|nr:hypothetical protein [Bacteriovoracaceae bacterium]
MKKYFLVIFMFTLFPISSYALDMAEIKEKLRPHAVKYLGEETAVKFLGEDPNEVKLPPIPKVIENATSIDVYNDKEDLGNIPKDKQDAYNQAFVTEVFGAVRNMKANRNDVAKWMNVLSQGGTREGMYRALVLDSTYAGLENYPNPLNDEIIGFSVNFYTTYVGRKIKKESLEKVNFYTLKRLATERTLEVVDELRKNKEHLQRWYAVFSGELAKNYPEIWNNKVRMETNKQFHLNWAKQAPSQHLKSEVIIKLHKTFNYLGK